MTLSDAALDQFEVLTQRTFLVLDTEYTNAEDGNHLISIGIVPVVRGKRARASQELYLEMNPGVPVDPQSSAIHGFTDADLARKRRFGYHAPRVLAALTEDAVLVCHTGVDVHLLRTELERLDEARAAGDTSITVGMADLPDLPIIDTSTLPRLLRLPHLGNRGSIGLGQLCELLDVTNRQPHHARSDARATADALIRLLLHAARRFSYDNLDALLADHARGTLRSPSVGMVRGHRSHHEPDLPAAHLARHDRPLLDPGSAAELDAWVAMAAECARLRCRHLLDAADLAATGNGVALLDRLTALLPNLTEPGQAGTLLGAVARLIAPEHPGARPTLAHTRAMRWWATNRQAIKASPACDRSGPNACPDCRDRAGCPRDTLYQPVTRIATLGQRGELTRQSINDRLFSRAGRGWRAITHWPDKQCVAYMAWYVVNWETEQGHLRAAANHLHTAMKEGLHLVEPRLGQLACESVAQTHGLKAAKDLAEQVMTTRTTDPAYGELQQWLTWHEHAAARAARAQAARVVTYPRLARPAGRVNRNPYLPYLP